MEILSSDEVLINESNARRKSGPNAFLNSRALMDLFQRTIDPNQVKFPFQVRVNLVDKIKIRDVEASGLVRCFPYGYHHLIKRYPELRTRILTNPMFGAIIYISKKELDSYASDKSNNYSEERRWRFQTVLGNLIFLHEWGHVQSIAAKGVTRYRRNGRGRECECESFAWSELSWLGADQGSLIINSNIIRTATRDKVHVPPLKMES